MPLIRDSERLADCCRRLAGEEFVAIDTEFIREKTYYPQLCVVQLAGENEAAVIDAVADRIDPAPLWELVRDRRVLKVFHAARQDIEIFHLKTGAMPEPIFDTQIAAMVCGFGEQAGYETLVQSLTGATIDKSARFTDWARRPLTEKQIAYALSDVTHLRTVYRKLKARLDATGRYHWVESEIAALADPALYRNEPREAWRRLKLRSPRPRLLAVLREIAAWRELAAQQRDIPRARMLRDEALLEIAAHMPRTAAELARTRGLADSMAHGRLGEEILAAVARGRDLPDEECPRLPSRGESGRANGATVELLRVLLKMKSDAHRVAPRLIAGAGELERIAADGEAADVPALNGWRHEIFGADALALAEGKLALSVRRGKVELVPAPER